MGPGFTLETALGLRDLGGGTKEWNEPSWSLSRSQGTNEEGGGGPCSQQQTPHTVWGARDIKGSIWREHGQAGDLNTHHAPLPTVFQCPGLHMWSQWSSSATLQSKLLFLF